MIHASEYNQSMSADFDVTIMEGTTIYDGIIVSGQAVKGTARELSDANSLTKVATRTSVSRQPKKRLS